jgi:hypothetical protein
MFKVKNCAKQETSRNRQQAQLGLFFDPEGGGNVFV